MEQTMVTRYSAPTKYDKAPFKSLCKMSREDGRWCYFIQEGENMEEPQWVSLGDFFEKAFEEYIIKPEFIDECLQLYRHNTRPPMLNISKIIGEKSK